MFLLFSLLHIVHSKENCQTGLVYTRYYNEISFINPAETKIIDTLNLPNFNYGYNSITVAGSFCPNVTGVYRAQVTGRPFCQLLFNGHRVPETIGPAGNCWPSTHDQYSIEDQHLNANQCYSFAVNARTGCSLYNQYLYLSFFLNDGPEMFPTDEYTTCIIDDCKVGFYGEKCQEKCETDCGENGFCFNGTKGNGKCICNDHWSGPDCNTYEEVIPPLGDQGADFTVYRNEITFQDPSSEETIKTIGVDSIGNIYNSMIIKGSILPEFSGEYQFRVVAKPFGQFNFEGTSTPAELGPAGSCNNDVISDYTSPVFTLNRHTTYPYELSYRSGCGLIYDKHLNLYWKNGPKWGSVDAAPWEPIPDFLTYLTTEKQCVPGTYGTNCEGTCKKCPENMVCNDSMSGDGTCVCPPHSDTCFCSPEDDPCENGGVCLDGICQCPENYYGEKCQRFCDAKTTCNGNGKCSDLGYCICDSKHSGDDCHAKCSRKDTCNGHGDCIEGGICSCDDNYTGNTCAHHFYQPSHNEKSKGAVFNHYYNEFFTEGDEELIDTVHRDSYDLYHSAIVTGSLVSYNKTQVEVRIRAKPFGEIRLDWEWKPYSFGPAGSCLPGFETNEVIDEFTMFPNRLYPFRLAWRSGCSLYPQHLYLEWRERGKSEWVTVPQENMRRAPANQICLERYYGEFCNEYCDSDCNMNGDCVLKDGKSTCKCFDNFYGPNCEFNCDPEINCSGHGRCDNDQCVCDAFHSGEHCEIGCSRENTCSNHGECLTNNTFVSENEIEDVCKCDNDWEGETCAQHVYQPSPNESEKGANYSLYSTESFSTITNSSIVENVTMNFSTLFFNSVTLSGAVVTKSHIKAKFRFTAKPHGQLFIGNQVVPAEIGPSFSCWGTTITEEETEEIDLLPNKLYPFTLKYKSGCSFIQQYVRLEWMVGANATWVDIPHESLVVPKQNQVCVDRYSGEDCTNYCDADCSMNGDCIINEKDGESICKCFDGFSGDHCEAKNRNNKNVIEMKVAKHDYDNEEENALGKKEKETKPFPFAFVFVIAALVLLCAIGSLIFNQKRKEEKEILVSATPLIQ